MEVGHLNLRPIYDLLGQHYSNVKPPPPLPPRTGSDIYKSYRQKYKSMLSTVHGNSGIYLWVCSQPNEEIEVVYVGMSQKNSRGLARRLDDEFRQWYHVFWMTKFNSERYIEDARRMYNKPTVDYTGDILMQARKAGGTHILYVVDFVDVKQLPDIETDLIYLFNCPRGNETPKRRAQMSALSNEMYSAFKNAAAGLERYVP